MNDYLLSKITLLYYIVLLLIKKINLLFFDDIVREKEMIHHQYIFCVNIVKFNKAISICDIELHFCIVISK